ncbi:ABC transporter family substrate-binding protein [Corynebacterium sp. ACRQP]|uniref:ABC transporter family substrate-binding protein n=1 Tax=Corynebacterium sp. ACRQP TaxID=2918195 RepID=UPI001EF41884|nr:ABC transporter family substrate-binding protein [Corynebacterium sp. ACRQP]MCG7235154.1 ABC transporter family substrate-binding protein [Corynebacterium sp. ACRQP]
MHPSRTRRPATRAAAAFSVLCLAASCAANPGPPPLVEPEDRPDAVSENDSADADNADAEHADEQDANHEPASGRPQAQVGVDPVRAGFNPHLVGDESAVVRGIADLVLPSAFRAGGAKDPNLLVGASVLPTSPAAFTVRYVIAPNAQWSDGTPITGADFAYLWRGMTKTPGVVDPAAYRAVADVRVSGPGGKVVDVDFAQPVGDWRVLFRHLLPSHLLAADAADFAYALRNTVPASAGRYLVRSVDRAHGTVTLNRNDRFWGPDPAPIDILTLAAARDTTQVADQLRSGQLAFVDMVPQDTSADVLGLVPGAETRTFPGTRTLGVTLSATSGLSTQARAEVRSLIDVPLLAHIAARRSTNVDAAAPTDPGSLALLHALAADGKVLRVAADAADPAASSAARSLVDVLNNADVPARIVANELPAIAARGLPAGEVDIVVHWRNDGDFADAPANRLASRIACPAETGRAGNLAGFCSVAGDELARAILAGDIPPEIAAERVAAIEHREALWVPLLRETRLAATAGGVRAAGTQPGQWPGGLSSAGAWTLADTVGRRTKIQEVP